MNTNLFYVFGISSKPKMVEYPNLLPPSEYSGFIKAMYPMPSAVLSGDFSNTDIQGLENSVVQIHRMAYDDAKRNAYPDVFVDSAESLQYYSIIKIFSNISPNELRIEIYDMEKNFVASSDKDLTYPNGIHLQDIGAYPNEIAVNFTQRHNVRYSRSFNEIGESNQQFYMRFVKEASQAASDLKLVNVWLSFIDRI